MKRRQFLGQSTSLLSIPILAGSPGVASATGDLLAVSPQTDRAYWLQTLLKIAEPVLTSLASNTLKATMPVESAPGQLEGRKQVSHLEALGRTLAGLAPWLETAGSPGEEAAQQRFRELSIRAIGNAVDPKAPDFLNFTKGGQPLVDAAFLAHALLRAPTQLWGKLSKETQTRLVGALQSTRVIKPGYNNWLLFSAMIEAALLKLTGQGDEMRMDYAIREHQTWYKGDGAYGDGPDFHWDYYNSYVIQPMLLDVLSTLVEAGKADKSLLATIQTRARRYGIVQERLIGPDGSFAAFGRSLAYRCGAFQLLAQLALQQQLPDELTPGQVRAALTAVIHRTMDPPGTFDANGWLQIGLCGHQPAIGETYISTGSLYLCTVGFLPLGLLDTHDFWSNPAADWTAKKIWLGVDVTTDHAIKG